VQECAPARPGSAARWGRATVRVVHQDAPPLRCRCLLCASCSRRENGGLGDVVAGRGETWTRTRRALARLFLSLSHRPHWPSHLRLHFLCAPLCPHCCCCCCCCSPWCLLRSRVMPSPTLLPAPGPAISLPPTSRPAAPAPPSPSAPRRGTPTRAAPRRCADGRANGRRGDADQRRLRLLRLQQHRRRDMQSGLAELRGRVRAVRGTR
jgi:hypothetical protein